MPISTFWFYEPRIIGVRDIGDISNAELLRASNDIIAMLDAGTPPVHLLLDLGALGGFPTTVSETAKLIAFAGHPALGEFIVWGVSGPVLMVVVQVLAEMISLQTHFVDSFDEALRLLAGLGDSLISLLPELRSHPFPPQDAPGL